MINVGLSTSRWAKQNEISCWFEPETTSTNTIAKDSGFKNEDSWIYVTNYQSQGRGRNTNSWLNADSKGGQLLVSWCFKLDSAPQPIASPLFGWALYKALNNEFDLNLSVKAPNDIFANSKKLAGILLESVSQGSKHFICVGVGINVMSKPLDFSEAGSLFEEIGIEIKEDRWFRFLSALNLNLHEAALMCQGSEIPTSIANELLLALKKWPDNNVTKVHGNGDLTVTLSDGEILNLPWTTL